MKTKLFTFFLALAASVGTMFANGTKIGDLYYSLNSTDKTAEVTCELHWDRNNYKGLTTANIPASVTYSGTTYSVTSIGNSAFYGCSSLTSVTIPNSVTSIGDGAFSWCSGLTSVTIPNSVTSIGDHAFYNCSSLTSVTIPNSVTSIGVAAFYYCSGLTSVTIPNSVTSIENSVFSGCSSLTSVTVEAGNTVYDSRNNCNAIIETATNTLIVGCQNTTIPNSVTSIGYGAFAYCSSLISVTIPNSVTSIGEMAFYECSSLTSVTIGNSVTSIGGHAFYGCSSLPVVDNLRYADTYLVEAVDKTLSSYTIKNGTRWIGNSAFYECSSLTSIEIPNSVTSIGNSAFYECSSLTSIEIPNSVTSIGSSAFYECSSLTSIEIPNSVTSIGSSAFYGCSSLPVVDNLRYADTYLVEAVDKTLSTYTIKDGTRFIGDHAFEDCSGLTSVTIPNSVVTMGTHVFLNCSSLVSVSIPNSVTRMGACTFGGCNSLTSFTLPASVTEIDEVMGHKNLFIYVPDSLVNISVEPGNPVFDSREHCNAIIETATNTLMMGCKSTTIPSSVTKIKPVAFSGCKNLKSFEIPENITFIGEGAFSHTGLTSITIPATVEIENHHTGDGSDFGVFSSNAYLTTIIFEEGVTVIPQSVFYACSNLTSIQMSSTIIGIGAQAFEGCSSLTSVTIPNSVTSIGGFAFRYCSGLTSIEIPNSVTSIGRYAFEDCSRLTSVTNYATIPQAINSNVFSNVDKSIPLYVPAESVEEYKAADGWKDFTNILPIGGIDVDHPTNPGTYQLTLNASIADAGVLTGAGMYAQGTEVSVSATANAGYTFEQWSDGVTDASRTIILVKDSTLTAIFSINHYTITFVDEDGTTVLASDEYEYGATPVAPANPTKAATAQYTYTFNGWSPDIATVTEAATYTATYSQTVNKYTVTFVDEDGTTVLASDEYEFGATPVAPADPIKAATAQYTYTFTGWSPAIATVTEAATYTATYSQTVNKYTVTFVDEDGTTVLASAEYEYGATPVAPANPTKAATAQYTYTFTGWSPAIANVTGTATYTATYSQTVNKYTITFMDEDGTTVLASDEYEYGATPVAPADPSKAATEEYTYTFSGWDKTIAVVTEAATYTATYSSQLNNVAIDGDQDLADLPVGENTHITVGEDGNLTVSEPTTIGTITVTVNGDEASEIIGVENLTVTNAEMILRLEPNKANATPNKWYAFGVPFEVEVSGGIYAQGSASPAIYNSAFVLDEYDGSLRASTQQGWKRVSSSAVLQPGVLYMIAVGSTTNEWHFVKRASASLTEQTSLSVAAYPSAIGAHHAGWNGLANTLFRDASVVLDGVQYITTYNNEQSVYEVQPIADATLAMAKPFFVQVPQAGTLHLTAQPAGVAARSLMAADEQTPSCVLSLSSADFTDRAYVTAQVGKQNAYSIGHDLMKMLDGTPSVPQLWLEGYNLRLAAYELALTSESTTVIIPLGLYAPQNGTYTLDAETQSDYYTLTLLADDTPVAELGEQTVSIELEQGNNSKYALCITKKADVVTNIINGTADGTQVVKFVQDDLLYILRDGKTYTIQGVEVK